MRADELHLRFASADGRSQTFLPCCAPASLAFEHPPSSIYEAFSSSLPFPFLFAPRFFTNRRRAFKKNARATPPAHQSTIPQVHSIPTHCVSTPRYFFRIRARFPADCSFFALAAFGLGSSDSGCHSLCTNSPNDMPGSRFRLSLFLGAFIDKSVTAPN
jgi:hypothetical protein